MLAKRRDSYIYLLLMHIYRLRYLPISYVFIYLCIYLIIYIFIYDYSNTSFVYLNNFVIPYITDLKPGVMRHFLGNFKDLRYQLLGRRKDYSLGPFGHFEDHVSLQLFVFDLVEQGQQKGECLARSSGTPNESGGSVLDFSEGWFG